jgi:hypothetical protein
MVSPVFNQLRFYGIGLQIQGLRRTCLAARLMFGFAARVYMGKSVLAVPVLSRQALILRMSPLPKNAMPALCPLHPSLVRVVFCGLVSNSARDNIAIPCKIFART